MNKIFRKLKNILYSLPFGLKAADNEILGSGELNNSNGTVITSEVNDKRVFKHLLKGEITQEVEELRYSTYKIDRESENYKYVGGGLATKKDKKKGNDNKIKFTQENKLVCNDILTELKRVNGYGSEKYIVDITYNFPVKIKFQEFLTFVDVLIINGKRATTTLRFDDIMNPSSFNSKPFVNELNKFKVLFDCNAVYGLNRSDFASAMSSLSFTTTNVIGDVPNVVTYSFIGPKFISISHENGEFKLVYEWDSYSIVDLTEKFYNKEIDTKYKEKAKKNNEPAEKLSINDIDEWWKNHYDKIIYCSKCNKEIHTYKDGFLTEEKTGNPICLNCYEKSLRENKK